MLSYSGDAGASARLRVHYSAAGPGYSLPLVTIHPFDDSNGRIAWAIADMVIARSEGSPQRFYSMSAQTRQERNSSGEFFHMPPCLHGNAP